MKRLEYLDPTDEECKAATVTKIAFPRRLHEGASDLAKEVWGFSKRKIVGSFDRVLLRPADSITNVFARKIEEFLSDEEHIERAFDGKRPTDSMIAKRAGFSRAKWNRLTSGAHLDIERGNAFAVAIALKLDEAQTAQLLYAGGVAINYEHELDCAMMYFIKNGIYEMDTIVKALSQFCDIKNGFDKFTFHP